MTDLIKYEEAIFKKRKFLPLAEGNFPFTFVVLGAKGKNLGKVFYVDEGKNIFIKLADNLDEFLDSLYYKPELFFYDMNEKEKQKYQKRKKIHNEISFFNISLHKK